MAERVFDQVENQEILRRRGRLEVITGAMFCGKSKELIGRVKRARITIETWMESGILPEDTNIDEMIKVFKPSIDNRRGMDTVNSENGDSYPAISIDDIKEIEQHLTDATWLVAIDESQFFNKADFRDMVKKLAREKNIRVIIAGLAMDFKAEEWGPVASLIPEAEEAMVVKGICMKCGRQEAVYTQRLIEVEQEDGTIARAPAKYDDPIVMIGAKSRYQCRCRHCYEAPARFRQTAAQDAQHWTLQQWR